jgi:tetratricopeptide (TPR) repeat protein
MSVLDSYEDIAARAQANLTKGNYAAALEGYQRLSKRLTGLSPVVLKRRPALHDLLLLSLIRQADIHHWRDELDTALATYQQLMALAPERREDWLQAMALVRIDMGQAEAGLDELRALAVARPDSLLWQTIGMECEALGRPGEAEESLRRAVQLAVEADSQREAYLALFDFYRAQDRVEEALAAWQQAWAGEPPAYVFPVYQMMREAGDFKRAHEYLAQEDNPLRKGFYQGSLAAAEGKADEAAKHWKRVAKLNPLKYNDGQDAWAEAALRADLPAQEVIAALNAASQAGGLSVHGIVLQAIAEARIGHGDHAREAFETARNVGLRSRPRQEKLSATHWALLDELVSDEALKNQLRPYFEVPAE